MKFGYQGALLYDDRKNFTNSEFLQYRVNNGVPDQLTQSISAFGIHQRVRSDAFYAQEQWTRGRMTLQGALRYDHAWSYFPEQTVGPVRFFPTAKTYPHTVGVEGYHDLWPRGGVAYDVFGTGKTSVKVNIGRYLEAAQNGGFFIALNPTGRLSTTTSRAWTDSNSNFRADCDLLSGAAQNLTATGGDICGANTNANFGTEVFDSTLDPTLLSGWGVRPGDWQWGASVQQEVLPRVAVEVGYQRRWLTNFAVTDNRARSAEDHTEFGVIIPTDPRLPGGGGGTLEGLYNVTPTAAVRLNDNFQTLATTYEDRTQVANSINMNVTARPRNGLVLQGGFNMGETASDSCDLRTLLPETARHQSVVRYLHGMGQAGDRARHLYRAEDRCARVRHPAQRPGRRPGGELGRAELRDGRAQSAVCRHRRPDDHGQPDRAGHALWGPRQPDRLAVREDPAVRPHAFQRGVRRLQRHELGAGADLQPELRAADGGQPSRLMADADVGAAAAVREVQRADRFLMR